MRLTSAIVIFTSSLALLFVSPAIASQGCSNTMLHGHYAHLIQGVFGPGTDPFSETYGPGTPFNGIQMLDFDGKGTLTGSESLVAGGGELTNPTGTDFAPLIGTYTINPDCTGIGYLCNNHASGVITEDPSSCNANTIGTPLWPNFVKVSIVLAERGSKFHMLVLPPYDSGNVVRTISSTGTKLDDGQSEHKSDH